MNNRAIINEAISYLYSRDFSDCKVQSDEWFTLKGYLGKLNTMDFDDHAQEIMTDGIITEYIDVLNQIEIKSMNDMMSMTEYKVPHGKIIDDPQDYEINQEYANKEFEAMKPYWERETEQAEPFVAMSNEESFNRLSNLSDKEVDDAMAQFFSKARLGNIADVIKATEDKPYQASKRTASFETVATSEASTDDVTREEFLNNASELR